MPARISGEWLVKRDCSEIHIPQRVLRDILRFAQETSVDKLVLFDSRARGTNTELSDIDLAVFGGDYDRFYDDVQEKTWSLLSFDLIDMDGRILLNLRKKSKGTA